MPRAKRHGPLLELSWARFLCCSTSFIEHTGDIELKHVGARKKRIEEPAGVWAPGETGNKEEVQVRGRRWVAVPWGRRGPARRGHLWLACTFAWPTKSRRER